MTRPKVLQLTREEFEIFNEKDKLGIFTLQTDRHLAGLPDEDILHFNYADHFCHMMDQLYKKFEYLIVTTHDQLFGFRENHYCLLYVCDGSFEMARNLK